MVISKRVMGYIGFLLIAQQVIIILYSLGLFDVPLFRSKALAKILNIKVNDSPFPLYPNTIGEVLIHPYQIIENLEQRDLTVFLTKIDKKKWSTDRILKELKEILDKENKKIALVFLNPSTFYPALLLFSDYSFRERIVSFNDVDVHDFDSLSLDSNGQAVYIFLDEEAVERLPDLKKQQFQLLSVLRNDYDTTMLYVYKME